MTALLAIAIALALPAGSSPVADPPSPAVAQAVAAALAVPGARAEVEEVRVASGQACAASRAEALRPVVGSGEVPLHLVGTSPDGASCQAYGWARVRVMAPALRLARSVASGEPLLGAVAPGEAEVRAGRSPLLATLPEGGRAARALTAGSPVLEDDVRAGPFPGEPVTVVIRAGAIELSLVGRAIPCTRGRTCALLPGGRRVEGHLESGHLMLEAQ